MSALSRGIVLGLEADRLILTAKPDEVARYTVGEAVQVLSEQGWQLKRDERYSFIRNGYDYTATGPRTHLSARLKTACGCERIIIAEWPPRNQLSVAMSKAVMLNGVFNLNVNEGDPSYRRRDFKLDHILTGADGASEAQYREVL